MPFIVTVDAYSACEAAARGLDEIIAQGGRITNLRVVEQVPGREFNISPDQILKWVSSYGPDDNVGLRQVKQRVHDKLKQPE